MGVGFGVTAAVGWLVAVVGAWLRLNDCGPTGELTTGGLSPPDATLGPSTLDEQADSRNATLISATFNCAARCKDRRVGLLRVAAVASNGRPEACRG